LRSVGGEPGEGRGRSGTPAGLVAPVRSVAERSAQATGRQYYVRQLRDAKVKPVIEVMDGERLDMYGRRCAWALARAHAKGGDAAVISGYLGGSDNFDQALGDFAIAYADQAERDHAALRAAVRKGDIAVQMEA
jgi:hypothetical protein